MSEKIEDKVEDKKNENEKEKQYSIGGFKFNSKQAVSEAKDELNAIKYMSSKTNLKDPHQAYSLYNKIIEKHLFRTQVGTNYLKQLQSFLYLSEEIPNEKIQPIPVVRDLSISVMEQHEQLIHLPEYRRLQYDNKRYKRRYNNAVIIIILLLITIAAMAVITLNSKNPNVLNYEINLQNKYAGWQQQLESQEASLKERESRLNER